MNSDETGRAIILTFGGTEYRYEQSSGKCFINRCIKYKIEMLSSYFFMIQALGTFNMGIIHTHMQTKHNAS
jgi:hypothetical protein